MAEVTLTSLIVPIMVSAVALFFIGFITWMVLPVHHADWIGLPDEESLNQTLGGMNVSPGNYFFPYAADSKEMQSKAFQEKQKRVPNGTLQVWDGPCNMGQTLACQFLFLLATCFCLAYLATLGLQAGDEFMRVFRFVGTAAMLTFIVGHVPGRIWYKTRLTGHLVDGVIMGLVMGLIFAIFWPDAPTAG